MIDKRVPRVLNSSSDHRIKKKQEFNDALNIRVSEDYGTFGDGVGDDTGNAGVIKPVEGNAPFAPNGEFTDVGTTRVVGTVSDHRAGVVYFFVSSSDPDHVGVYAADTTNFFGQGENTQVAIYKNPALSFDSNSFVRGEVVYIYDESPERDFKPVLYFTDNINEPRRIDVFRALEIGGEYSDQTDLFNGTDFICACPKTPLAPPTFQFFTDTTRTISEFRSTNGFQFAYQCLYITGEETALSTFSKLAVPPAYTNQGSNLNVNLNSNNGIRITIPRVLIAGNVAAETDDVFNFSDEINQVRLLCREGDRGQWLVIDEVDVPAGNADIVYDFFNDRVFSGLPIEEQEKQFDSLPRAAEALAVVEDRLFYGNYLEGYDVPNVEATVSVAYQNRPQDFVDIDVVIRPRIFPLTNEINPDDITPLSLGENRVVNRVAGLEIDCSGVTGDIPAGSIITASVRVNPSKNWHVYNSENAYHAFTSMGIDGNAPQSVSYNESYAPVTNYPRAPLFANNDGVSNRDLPALQWETFESADDNDGVGTVDVKLGCSAGAPLVIQSKEIEFSFSAIMTADIESLSGAFELKEIIWRGLLGEPLDAVSAEYIGDAQSESGYLVTVPLSFDQVHDTSEFAPEGQTKFAIIDPNTAEGRTTAALITPVHPDIETSGTTSYFAPVPCGYFLIRSAEVRFRLRRFGNFDQQFTGGDGSEYAFLGFDISRLNIQGAYDSEEPGIVTCFPVSFGFASDGDLAKFGRVREWRAYKYYDLQNSAGTQMFNGEGRINQVDKFIAEEGGFNYVNPYFNIFQWVDFLNEGPDGFSDLLNTLGGNTGVLTNNSSLATNPTYAQGITNRKKLVGGLVYTQNGADENFSNNLLLRSTEFPEVGTTAYGEDYANPAIRGFSLVDGESGIKNFKREADLQVGLNDNEGVDRVSYGDFNLAEGNEVGPYQWPQIMFGHASSVVGGNGAEGLDAFSNDNVVYPLEFGQIFSRFALLNSPVHTQFGTEFFPNRTSAATPYETGTNGNSRAQVELLASNAFFSEGEDGDINRSFKTSANHQLGIVYYDERGRSGPVCPLPSRENPSVYVAGYSSIERPAPGLEGRTEMIVQMDTDPPDWAYSYQFVYAGNSTYSDWIQYTAGGAFVASDNNEETRKIYVSLNYLQENVEVSYAEAWGAVDYTGDKRFYQFVPGDYVRIISYNTNDDQRNWAPPSYTFEVVDAVTLPDNIEENPLATGVFSDEGGGVHPARTGSFIVLRDNPNAAGFSASDVASGSLLTDTQQHYWNNRTVIEIVRPKKSVDTESLIYYEIGEQYSVGRDTLTNTLYHQFDQHVIRDGDVWWRRVPVNVPEFDESQGVFVNLIQEEDPETLLSNAPRFRDVYLETMAFNDSYAGNRQVGRGKPKPIGPQNQEIRRFSSITFSDVNDYSTPINKFTSFNAYNAPFKDLPNEFGNINFLLNYNGSLFVLQEDKASQVPINRDIITTATGQDSLTVTNKVVGAQIMYAGTYGTDNHPESVVRVDNNIYFAHAGRGEVYKFNPSNGITVISMKGMASMIRDEFQDAVATGTPWIVSGYDPLNDEYLITITSLNTFNFVANQYPQPNFLAGVTNVTPSSVPDIITEVGGGPDGPEGPPPDVFDGAFDDPVPPTGVANSTGVIDINWDEAYNKNQEAVSFELNVFESGLTVPFPSAGIESLWDSDFGILDVSSFVSQDLADAIGEKTITSAGQGSTGTTIGFFNAPTREISLTNQTNATWTNAQIFGGAGGTTVGDLIWNSLRIAELYSLPTAVGQSYVDISNGPLSLGEHASVAIMERFDQSDQAFSNARTNGDANHTINVAAISEEARDLVTLLEEYSSEPAIATFALDISNAADALDALVPQYPYSVGDDSVTLWTGETISYPKGYSIDYKNTPRGGAFDIYLNAITNLVNALNETATSLNPNNLLDASGVYQNLSARIAGLQSSLDAVTNQLEEASSISTVLDPEQDSLLPFVESGNNNAFSLAALTQVGDLVLAPELAEALSFLSANGVEITAEIVESLSNQVAQALLDQYAGTDLQKIFYNSYRTDGSMGTSGQTSVEALDRALDLVNFDGQGTYGTSALLNLLTDPEGIVGKEIFGAAIISPNSWYSTMQTAALQLPATASSVEVVDFFTERLVDVTGLPEAEVNIAVSGSGIGFLWGPAAAGAFGGALPTMQLLLSIYSSMLAPIGGQDVALPILKGPVQPEIYNNPNKIGTGSGRFSDLYQEIADSYNA